MWDWPISKTLSGAHHPSPHVRVAYGSVTVDAMVSTTPFSFSASSHSSVPFAAGGDEDLRRLRLRLLTYPWRSSASSLTPYASLPSVGAGAIACLRFEVVPRSSDSPRTRPTRERRSLGKISLRCRQCRMRLRTRWILTSTWSLWIGRWASVSRSPRTEGSSSTRS